jgi:hypothetical protein
MVNASPGFSVRQGAQEGPAGPEQASYTGEKNPDHYEDEIALKETQKSLRNEPASPHGPQNVKTECTRASPDAGLPSFSYFVGLNSDLLPAHPASRLKSNATNTSRLISRSLLQTFELAPEVHLPLGRTLPGPQWKHFLVWIRVSQIAPPRLLSIT